MVTQNGDLSVGTVISIQLLLECRVGEWILVKQTLERDRGIESTEHLGRQPFHLIIEMFIQRTCLTALLSVAPPYDFNNGKFLRSLGRKGCHRHSCSP